MSGFSLRGSYRQTRARARRLRDALAGSDLALAIMPASAETKRHYKARADAMGVLAADPNNATAWRNLGGALSGLKRYKQAIACYDKALALVPDSPTIWMSRTAALTATNGKAKLPDVARNPRDANAWAIRAGAFSFWERFAEAAEASDRALSLDPGHVAAARVGIRSRLHACDWHSREDDKRRIATGLKAGLRVISPGNHRLLCDSEEEHHVAAQLHAKGFLSPAQALWRGERYRHDKIRIAYLSADFHIHATAYLMAGVFEAHDSGRFETTAISFGPVGEDPMRARLQRAFGRFLDVGAMPDLAVAELLRRHEIDIAIDLKGYTGGARQILAHRPAPVQVNYLGYPGTMGVPFMDYILADRTVIPEEHRIYYSEKVVYLPHSYQSNDINRQIAKKTPSRAEVGLPETGFVFACFNNTYKIGPETFDVWMRLLDAVDGSVLWLLDKSPAISLNLRREAKTRGIAPERLVFAPSISAQDHLARLRVADLFLDTRPYNAHTTASDALWAGLPVVTCPGNTFPARVAASLLHAIGLPELVTASLAEYEELARTLAGDPERLAALKAKLMRNRDAEPLFDTARFTRDLETAYTMMWERQQAGLPPESFAVAAAYVS